jgi:hypothetical protein
VQPLQNLDTNTLGKILRHAGRKHSLSRATTQIVENETSLRIYLAQYAVEGVVFDLAVD